MIEVYVTLGIKHFKHQIWILYYSKTGPRSEISFRS